MCRKLSLKYALLLLLLCYYLDPVIILAEETTENFPENTAHTESELSESWNSLEELLQMLKSEATLQSEDLMKLSEALEQSRTEINELNISLKQLERQLYNLEQYTTEQDKEYQRMEKERNIWRTATIGSTILSIMLIIEGLLW